MADVFVNYRTADARYGAAGVYELLSELFGPDRVFRDCVSMRPGERYPDAIRERLESARVLLVLIGPGWFARRGGRLRRRRLIDDPRDWVRREIRRALERRIPVVPVLLDGVPPPAAGLLPADVADLANAQAAQVGHRAFGDDVRRLAERIVEHVPELLLPDLFATAPALPAHPLPSMLLRAEYRVVPFDRRDTEIADLTAWLASPDQVSVRLLTGPGGQGKTRLADELIRRADGWTAGFLAEEVPPSVVALIRRFRAPLLLVVDYAEGRTAQLTALAEALVTRPADRGPVRVLMLARSAGLWQRLLRGARDDRVALLFAQVPAISLGPLAPSAGDHGAEFDRAVEAFAAVLPEALPVPARPPGLAGARYDRALDVHAAALAALLDEPATAPSPPPADPVARVLDHERRQWAAGAAPHSLPDPHPHRLDQVVAAATLAGAGDPASARTLLAALPTFEDGTRDTVDRYRRWLADVYPGPAALNPLRPDRLGEDLTAAALREHPDLASALAPVLDDAQLTRALTVLGRAAPRHPHARDAMAVLLTPDLLARVPFAIAVATRTEDLTLTGILSELLDGQDDLALDEAVVEHLPDQTLVLAAFAVVRTRAALDRHLAQDDPDPGVTAWLTHNLSVRLDAVGQYDEALTTASRAVALMRRLTERDRAYAPDLASALNTLADAHIALGLFEDAAEPAEEALSIVRGLDPTPETRHVLSASLMTYGGLLGHLARHGEAVAAVEEAVRLQRAVLGSATDADRADRLFELAGGLDNLATAVDRTGRHHDALAMVVESAELHRALDAEHGDRFRGDLIRVLANLIGAYATAGRWEEGAAVAEEAVGLARDLVARHGDVHRPRLADILLNSASVLRRLGRHDDALPQIREAVALYREGAVSRPGTELSGLAAALHNLANGLQETGDSAGARDAYDESIDIYRKLSDPYPGSFEPELADVLAGLADLLDDDGDHEPALDAAAEAAAILTRLVDEGRTELRRKLGSALHLLAAVRYSLGQYTEAARVEAKAVGVLTALVRLADRDARDHLAAALHGQARAYDVQGRHEDASRCFGQALALVRELAGESDAHDDELAGVLLNYAVCLSSLGRDQDAYELITESVAIRRRFPAGDARHRRELAEALNNLADTRHDLGDVDGALVAAREAAGLCAALYDDGDHEDDGLYVYVLCTLATVEGARDLDSAVSSLVTARRVARESGDDTLMPVVRTALAELGPEARTRRVWRTLTGDPYP